MAEKKVQQRTIESRDKIKKAAWELFCEKGYFHTNTKEIAKTAGVSIGNFYNYYKDKYDVYYELTEEYNKNSIETLRVMIDDPEARENSRDVFVKYMKTVFHNSANVGRFYSDCGVLMHDDQALSNLFSNIKEEFLQVIEQKFAMLPVSNRRASVPVMSRVAYDLIDKAAEEIRYIQDEEYCKEYEEQMIEVVLSYVFGK